MFPILLLLFIFVPIIEIALFIQVGGFLGLWPTIALVLITAVVGASLVRSQGLATLTSVQNRLQQGELPAQQIVEGVMLAVAGVLLLTPGFMTDCMGMTILLPA
ncbi:FxsA family protein, partial [Photobacterium damselae subsp. damselae]|nr:FxsA family protein [Photobacterium damselae subsp. damselae]